jgi:hypothetical protein
MHIMIQATQCGGVPVTFDNMQLALGFARMLAGNLTPDLFVDLIHKLMPSPTAVDLAKQLVKVCMGTPS